MNLSKQQQIVLFSPIINEYLQTETLSKCRGETRIFDIQNAYRPGIPPKRFVQRSFDAEQYGVPSQLCWDIWIFKLITDRHHVSHWIFDTTYQGPPQFLHFNFPLTDLRCINIFVISALIHPAQGGGFSFKFYTYINVAEQPKSNIQ